MTKQHMAKQHSQQPSPRAAPREPTQGDKSAELSKFIGRELRAMFDDVVAEPVPEKFQKLLAELERKYSKP